MTKFSVLIPVYNGEKAVARALDSVLKQTCGDWELLVCDDGSADGTWEILERYAQRDARIKLLKHEQNRGGLCARNTLIRNFTGEYCVWLDADDELVPDFLETAGKIVNEGDWDIVHFPQINRYLDGHDENSSGWSDFSYRGDNLLQIFFTRVKNRLGVWGKAIRGDVMKRSIAPDVRTFCDDMFLALPMFYFAKSYTVRAERPMYIYYLGTGYWSPLYERIDYEPMLRLLELKRQLFSYHSTFLAHHGVKVDPGALINALDIGQHLFDILKLPEAKERESALVKFMEFFGISLVPRPYQARFYPHGCEPKRYTYSLKFIQH